MQLFTCMSSPVVASGFTIVGQTGAGASKRIHRLAVAKS